MQHALSLTPDLEIMAPETFSTPPAFKVPGEFSGSKHSCQGLVQIMFVSRVSAQTCSVSIDLRAESH